MISPTSGIIPGSSLLAYRWRSSLPPQGNVLVLHGLGSHCLRFQSFSSRLAEDQWNVFGHNLRGHGSQHGGSSLGEFGKTGWQDCLDDIATHALNIQRDFPDLPLFLLGQGVGSYLVQDFVFSTPDVAQGMILCGTNGPTNFSITLLQFALSLDRFYRRPSQDSPLLQKITTAAWTRHLSTATDHLDWLSHDEEILRRYRSDPACGFSGSICFWGQLLHALRRISIGKQGTKLSADFPILLASGTQDPVGEFGVGVHRLMSRFGQAGLQRVAYRLYPHLRHEILWGTNTEAPTEDILNWLCETANSPRRP